MDRSSVLSRTECLELLRRAGVGRIAFTERALPAIRPVNYTLIGSHLALRTEGKGLGRRLDGQVVAFEVDCIDADQPRGWSVVVTGTARLVHRESELLRHDGELVAPLVGPGHDSLVLVTLGEVTGRRVGVASAG